MTLNTLEEYSNQCLQRFYDIISIFFQVMSLSPAPLSLLIKAAPILTEEMYGDIQPAAWELLLSMDEHMAGAAGKERPPGTLVLLPLIPAFKQERGTFIPFSPLGQIASNGWTSRQSCALNRNRPRFCVHPFHVTV